MHRVSVCSPKSGSDFRNSFSASSRSRSLRSLIDSSGTAGSDLVALVTNGITKELRNWLFCLAFVCIGLEMHLKTFASSMRGGKPLVLYLVGQAFNLLLTGLMAWFTFGYLFRDTIDQLLPK